MDKVDSVNERRIDERRAVVGSIFAATEVNAHHSIHAVRVFPQQRSAAIPAFCIRQVP